MPRVSIWFSIKELEALDKFCKAKKSSRSSIIRAFAKHLLTKSS